MRLYYFRTRSLLVAWALVTTAAMPGYPAAAQAAGVAESLAPSLDAFELLKKVSDETAHLRTQWETLQSTENEAIEGRRVKLQEISQSIDAFDDQNTLIASYQSAVALWREVVDRMLAERMGASEELSAPPLPPPRQPPNSEQITLRQRS